MLGVLLISHLELVPYLKKKVGAVCGLQPNPPTKVKLWKKGETRAFDLTRQPPAPPRRTNPVIEKQELDT